ncbi:hybrid sensor histidine kinase/response regulator [Massilia sp.]|uniref:hybrid sensor histidine kinase/response regulator n=1 Tax=Massilia sp. TaxID=1882437 RepID=UPI00289AD2F6|nr:hybrid sensor histidine kinase/response regulator [Massilia sp.]
MLTNASRYSQAADDIVVRTAVVGGELEIEVSDNGTGLSADLLPRIFEPFMQGERTLHGAVGGLGIGLALVKNLTELHGGSVVARSAGSGKGSTFTVRLPLTSEAMAPEPATVVSPAPSPRNRQHVLVVDDNIDAADTLAEILRAYGHVVTAVYTPEDALQAFMQQHLDLAILDIGLPGTDGYELADLMRGTRHNASVRYVALTGFGQAIDQQRSAAAGFAAHLVKPLASDSLAILLGI